MTVADVGAEPSLVITLFGAPSIAFGVEAIRLDLPASVTLLAYLAIAPERAHPRATIAGALWPDDDDDEARAKLRRHLHALQRALPKQAVPWILSSAGTLRWNPESRWSCDAAAFDRALASGNDLAATLEYYTGDFLAGDTRHWTLERRERYRVCAAKSASALARDAATRGELREARKFAQRAFAWEPDSDPAARALIELLGAVGDRVGADAVYAHFAERMRREADATPDPETIAAIERVRLLGVADRRRIAPDVTPFIGRSEECEAVIASVRTTRLVTLTGPSGIGKTRVAIEAARRLASDVRDGVLVVDLLSAPAEATIVETISRAVGIAPVDFDGFIRERSLLIVLDNCDRDVATEIAKVLTDAAEVRILATGLTALGSRSETIVRIGPMNSEDATALFCDRGKRAAPHVMVSANRKTIERICASLDGFPLAIELAAGRLDSIALDEIVPRLADRFALLADDDKNAPLRHRALRAAVAWSYAALDEIDRRVLERVAIFYDDWSLDAARTVCSFGTVGVEALQDSLDRLVQRSLIVRDGRSGRYRTFRTIHEFARGELAASGDELRARDRFLLWAESCAERIYGGSHSSEQADMFALADREFANFRVAIELALVQDRRLAGRLCGALGIYLDSRAREADGARWLAAALDAEQDTDGRALITASLLLRNIDAEASLGYAKRATAAYETQGDLVGVALALRAAGVANVFLGDVDAAAAAYDASLALRDRHTDVHAVAGALVSLGYVFEVRGDADGAGEMYQRGLDLALRAGDRRLAAAALMSLSGQYFYAGDTRSSRAYLERAIEFAREIGHTSFLLHGLRNMGEIDRAEGRTADALIDYVESFRRAREAGDLRAIVLALNCIAGLIASDDAERAARLMGAAAARRALVPPIAESPGLLAEREEAREQSIARLGEEAFEVAVRIGRTYRDVDLIRELAALAPEAMPL